MLPLLAGLVAAGAAAPAAEADVVLGQGGRTGYSAAQEPAGCRHYVFPSRGILRAWAAPPVVKGVNLRRGRRDFTRVRYRVHFTAQHSGDNLATSGWSTVQRVSDRRAITWSGLTSFDGDWRGGYYLDLRIEWLRRGRMLGWRAHRIDNYSYYNQYNVGPLGPMGACFLGVGY
jgi:hypothetical protein